MAAIGTDSLKRLLANLLVTEVSSSNNYFVGIGKSDAYNATDTVINPTRTIREERIARANLQSVIKIADVSMVAERYNWTSGQTYSSYNDSLVGLPANPFYVLTEDNEVYICLQQGKSATGASVASTIQPSYTLAGVSFKEAFETTDGYRWKFMYQISSARATRFLSANFMPVQTSGWQNPGDSASLNSLQIEQLNIEISATKGQILGANITNGGSGYSSAPTVTIKGNGSNAAATATINAAGSVVKIETNNESAACGSGYDIAEFVLSSGSGTTATARPIISPIGGIGSNAIRDLKASSIMFNVKPDGQEGGDFIINNDFRQIIVMKDVEEPDSAGIVQTSTARALKYLQLDSAGATSNFVADALIRGQTSSAGAYIDEIDSAIIYYHQNEATGFGTFVSSETIADSDTPSITGTISSVNAPTDADGFSGEVIYIENRANVSRSSAQQEDIKVIITI